MKKIYNYELTINYYTYSELKEDDLDLLMERAIQKIVEDKEEFTSAIGIDLLIDFDLEPVTVLTIEGVK